jgi:hypothetical protein
MGFAEADRGWSELSMAEQDPAETLRLAGNGCASYGARRTAPRSGRAAAFSAHRIGITV